MKGALEKFAARIRENVRSRPDGDIDVAGARASMARMGNLAQPAPGTTHAVTEIAGVPCIEITPQAHDDRTIVYFHGGLFALGSAAVYRGFLTHVAAACGSKVCVVDYRLAPDHPFPAAPDDAWAVWKALASKRNVVMGDSAGANLALVTMVRARDEGLPLPAASVMLSPWIDLEHTGASMTANAEKDPLFRIGDNRAYVELYVGGKVSPRDPRVSPLHADLHGLPPAYVQVGKDECLLDDSTRLFEKARAAGVDVTLDAFDDVFHDWHFFAGIAPEADDAIARIGRFVLAH